jgi:hypothetical protein
VGRTRRSFYSVVQASLTHGYFDLTASARLRHRSSSSVSSRLRHRSSLAVSSRLRHRSTLAVSSRLKHRSTSTVSSRLKHRSILAVSSRLKHRSILTRVISTEVTEGDVMERSDARETRDFSAPWLRHSGRNDRCFQRLRWVRRDDRCF